ncbi:MAG TPA: hypothetical protein VJ696_10400 [Rhodanobacteraceae bacterium]|nr:hypothetical protein [Rhodanobacteraceae bacterium]
MNVLLKVAAPCLLLLALPAAAAPVSEHNAAVVSRGADYVSPPAVPERIFLDARTRPHVPDWHPGDPIREIPRQFHGEEELQRVRPAPANPTHGSDLLAELQRRFGGGVNGGGFTTPLVNEDGTNDTGVVPPDPTGDVGGGYYVHVYNGAGGAVIRIYNTSDGSAAAGPFNMDGLGSGGPCASGLGDGVVVFDQLAQRWLLTEFSGTSNTLCTYLSEGDDPVVTTWTRYTFNTPGFPDYPKYGVWPDAYYVGANEGPGLYALDRQKMLAGLSATLQRKQPPRLAGLGFQMLPPVTVYGATPPPAGAPGIFIRDNDDERNSPSSNDPDHDFLELFTMSVDWTTPANTTLTGPVQVAESEFDSEFQVGGGFGAIHQPGTGQTLDPLLEVPMVPITYRNFGTYESLVGNHVTRLPDDTTNNIAGVRWFEMRRTGGATSPWQLYQEGTYAPADAGGQISRWMAAIAMDDTGNIAMAYSVARDPGVFPGLRYVGREASDPLGVMTTPETTLVDGASSQTFADRWGDYFGMGVDSSDGCTFWFTGMYTPSGGDWRTRFASFKFDNCGSPSFSMTADNLSQSVCAASATPVALQPVTIDIDASNGFTTPVTMSFQPGLPPGFTGGYSVNPVTPPGSTVANISVDNTAAPGANSFVLRGSAAGIDRDLELDVDVVTAAAAAPALTTPADGATNVSAQPLFSWSASPQATSYLIEIATDADFANVILSQTVTDTSFQPTAALPLNAEIFWRVTANNECGAATSAVFSFSTQPGPGQCGAGTTTETIFEENAENGGSGWTHDAAAGTDTWAISPERPFEGANSWKALDPATVSDQRLTSPVITLPDDLDGLSFQFQQFRKLEGGGSTCLDGGILEMSIDGGPFSQVPDAQLLVGGYDGTVTTGSGNPLAGNPAWCGPGASYQPVIADLGSYAGHDVQFRFRLGSNSSVSRDGWWIDAIKVQGCGEGTTDRIFADGFEQPTF